MLVALLFLGEIMLKLCSFFPNYAFFFKIMLFEKITNKSKKYIFN